MPPQIKSKSKKTSVSISRIHHGPLLDPRIKRGQAVSSAKLGLLIACLGFLAVSAATYYFLFRNNPLESDFTPQIVVPAQQAPTPSPEPVVAVKQVEILPTPTGYLNVREGPGTVNPKVAELHPGEVYTLLEEDTVNGWYKIKIDETLTGWVTGQYAKVK